MASSMNALGESVVPLCFLMASSLLNAALAWFLTARVGLGLDGAAYTTVVSQAFAALLCFLYIRARMPQLLPRRGEVRVNLALLKRTASYSTVSGIQQAVLYIGIFLMQGAVNPLGIDSIAAFNAASRIDGFVMIPGDSIASALMMFVSQNRGARREDRVRAGLRQSAGLALAAVAVSSCVLLLYPKFLVGFFLKASDFSATAQALAFIKLMSGIYFISVVCNTFQGFFRGLGRMDITLYATLIQIPVRVGLTYALAGRLGICAAAVGIGGGWVLMAAYELTAYTGYLKGAAAPLCERAGSNGGSL